MAKIKLLYTSALDSKSTLVTALQAEKGDKYSCPLCQGEMILRKSGKEGPGSRRPHFAHKALTPNCTPEGVLHHSFKMMFADILKAKLANNEPFPLSFTCGHCGEVHEANLLKITKEIVVEKNLGTCIPDIALIDKNGKPYLAIEIVVTHPPEEESLEYYRKNNISLYRLNIKSDVELDDIENRAKKPDEFWFCKNPKCPICGSYMDIKIMAIGNIKCHRCRQPMKIAMITSSADLKKKDGNLLTPYYFGDDEILFAEEHGVTIRQCYSKTRTESYLANVCPHCNAFIGEHFMIDYIMELCYYDDNEDSSMFEKVKMGWFCPKCEMGIEK